LRLRFVARLALREGQSALRRIGVFAASIALGVGTLVAIHGLREDMKDSLGDESQSLLGADVRFGANAAFSESVVGFLDSLGAAGAPTSSVTTVLSMVMATKNEAVRLLQVRGIEGGYPFYGNLKSTPADAWRRLREPGNALVEPGVLTQLGVQIGDSLLIGESRFVIAGSVEGLPAELGLRTAGGPRVHISAEGLDQAGLLTFGSLARYETYVRMPDARERSRLRRRFDDLPGRGQARFTTAELEARELTRAVDWLGRYLGLVGLAALLLGAVGVASAVHVFVKEKLASVAVLRCLGARQTDVFAAYVLLTAGLGLVGSLAGAVLGVATVMLVPGLVSRILPVKS
jgi:putative ABC transport system permease protein